MANKPLLINKKTAFALSFAVFLFIVDRVLKYFALSNYNYQILGNTLRFDLAKNYGIAFSLPLGGVFLNVVITAILFFLLAFMATSLKKSDLNYFSATFLVMLGAVSNFIDRLSFGYVVDYFDLAFFTVFNLADVMIFSGVCLLIVMNKKQKLS